MTPESIVAAIATNLRADLQLGTLDDAPALVLTLAYDAVTICTAKCALPDAPTVEVTAPCPHPHSHTDAVRAALLGVVAELRRASRIVASSGEHYRAEAFEDAANYIEDGRWGAKP